MLSSHVILCSDPQVCLVLLTVHSLVDGLARQAVLLSTHWAVKEVDQVFINAPAGAVRCLTVVAVDLLALSCLQTSLKEPLKHCRLYQLQQAQ